MGDAPVGDGTQLIATLGPLTLTVILDGVLGAERTLLEELLTVLIAGLEDTTTADDALELVAITELTEELLAELVAGLEEMEALDAATLEELFEVAADDAGRETTMVPEALLQTEAD